MRKAQIIIDIIALIVFAICAILGVGEVRPWMLIVWVSITLSAHIQLDKYENRLRKGGCTGCGYDIKPGETPLECLQRMERERKF